VGADPVLARELKSLHEEITVAQRERDYSPPCGPCRRSRGFAGSRIFAAGPNSPDDRWPACAEVPTLDFQASTTNGKASRSSQARHSSPEDGRDGSPVFQRRRVRP